METIKNYYKILPLTFQKAQINIIYPLGEELIERYVDVESLKSDKVLIENFHKPISKILKFNGVK